MRGFYAIGAESPKTSVNIGTLWRSANIFGAACIFTIGRRYHRQSSDTLNTPRHVPLWHFDSVDELVRAMPEGAPLVGVELTDTAIPIGTFVHPQRAVYLLGAEDNGLSKASLSRCHHVVRLPGESSLNVAVAGSIVAYDRLRSRGEP